MDENVKKAFEFASDVAKQLITLSTGIIAIVFTFSKDIVSKKASADFPTLMLGFACGLYFFSIVAGLWHLYALTGELESTTSNHQPTTRGKNAIVPSIIQIIFFLVGTAMMIVYGIAVL